MVLRSLPAYSASQHIACYLAFQDEFMTMPLIEMLWQDNKTCYLPVLMAEKNLQFLPYHQGDSLKQNQFGIGEPQQQRPLPAEQLDMIILPLVAFDSQGNRLGTGGGYYDRSFAWKQHTKAKKPLLIGLGYALQQADELPVEEWDISVDGVITESGFIKIAN